MALINCPECQKEVSDKAATCPNCGFSINQSEGNVTFTIASKPKILKFIPFIVAGVVLLGGVGIFFGIQIHNRNKEIAIQQAIIVKDKQAFEIANGAYEKLCTASDSTITVMTDIYEAWRFGIHDADDSTVSTVIDDLSKHTSVSKNDLEAGVASFAKQFDSTEKTLLYAMVNGSGDVQSWQWCLMVMEEAYKINGTYDNIRTNIEEANTALKTMTTEYDDYKHYPTLKEFYSKVSSYFDFAENPSGSFNQLVDTKNDYENSIRTYRSDLDFIFKE